MAPEARYLWFAAFVIVAGGVGGTLIHDHWARAVSFVSPQGIGIFALFYIIAQVIERVQEPIVPYLGQAKDPGEEEKGRKNQRQAKGALERAVVAGFDQPEKGSGQATREADVANRERCGDLVEPTYRPHLWHERPARHAHKRVSEGRFPTDSRRERNTRMGGHRGDGPRHRSRHETTPRSHLEHLRLEGGKAEASGCGLIVVFGPPSR